MRVRDSVTRLADLTREEDERRLVVLVERGAEARRVRSEQQPQHLVGVARGFGFGGGFGFGFGFG